MKLKDACELAENCGLWTIEEAITNAEHYFSILFSYNEMKKELDELYNDVQNCNLKDSIFTIIGENYYD